MREVWPRLEESVARRLRIYAASEDIDRRRAGRKIVAKWLAKPVSERKVPSGVGHAGERICVTLGESEHEAIRIAAAAADVEPAALVAYILTTLVPFETEVAADSITKGT